MPLSGLQTERISEAVGQKITKPCPLCGERAWAWGPDLLILQSQMYETAQLGLADILSLSRQQSPLAAGTPLAMPARPAAYPVLLLMCNHCGNTALLNVYALGIADIWPAIAAGRV